MKYEDFDREDIRFCGRRHVVVRKEWGDDPFLRPHRRVWVAVLLNLGEPWYNQPTEFELPPHLWPHCEPWRDE